ncbi:MAG: molecular chaperone TorD family protein [Lautropia sp.]|nr:molecular chaperone TorD family protein [Lautropia sp.]
MRALFAADVMDTATVADWLSVQIIAPPALPLVRAGRSVAGQLALREIGCMLQAESAMDKLRQWLTACTESEVARTLQCRHTALFEGIFGYRSLPPYASSWDGTGHLFGEAAGRMKEILRRIDCRVADHYREPPDHLGVQLAALAQALRVQDDDVVHALSSELRWVEPFARALIQADENGFYEHYASLLMSFVDGMRDLGQDPVRAVDASVR